MRAANKIILSVEGLIMKTMNVFFLLLITGLVRAQTITSFTPVSGPTGQQGTTTLTINGTGFSTTAANNIIFFGAVYKPALTASATQLTVNVPTGATCQNLSVVNTETGLTAHAYTQTPFLPTYYNEGSMQFSGSSDFSYTYGFAQPYCKVADMDGDGKPDLVFVHKEDSSIAIIRNTSTIGSLSFDTTHIYYSSPTGYEIYAFEIADMNGDGKPDIVFRTYSTSNIFSIISNTSTSGTVSLGARFDFSKSSSQSNNASDGRDINVTDIDGDGKNDILVTSDNEIAIMRVMVYQNLSTTSAGTQFGITPTTIYSTSGGSSKQSITSADFDGDGKVDVGLVSVNTGSKSVFLATFYNNSTSGTIGFSNATSPPLFTLGTCDANLSSRSFNVITANAGDLNGDGKPDLATANRGGKNMVTLLNNGTQGSGNFAARVGNAVGLLPSCNKMLDFDGDGKLDLASTFTASSGNLIVQRNNSSASAIAFGGRVLLNVLDAPQWFELCDFDGDGKPDIVVVNNTTLSIQKSLSKHKALFLGKFAF